MTIARPALSRPTRRGYESAGVVEAIWGDVVVQVGDLPGGPVPAPPNLVMAREIGLRGSLRFRCEVAEAVGLIGAGRGDVLAIVTARHPRPSVAPSTGTAA